jgi:hypothetical protein
MLASDHGLRVVQGDRGRDLLGRARSERRQSGASLDRTGVAPLRGAQQRLRLLLQLLEIRTGR